MGNSDTTDYVHSVAEKQILLNEKQIIKFLNEYLIQPAKDIVICSVPPTYKTTLCVFVNPYED